MIATLQTAPDVTRLTAASTLQSLLPELVGLGLQAKQAHWNMTGSRFLALHSLADRIATDTRGWADRVAERAVALGYSVDARPGTVSSAAGSFPAGRISCDEAITELAALTQGVAMRVRSAIGDLERADPVAHHIAIDVLEGLDRYHWMLEAQKS